MYQSRIRNAKRGRQQKRREFVEVGEGQMWALVQDLLGNGRVRVFCEDEVVRIARIRGSLRKYSKKEIIERGDVVLVAGRDFSDDKVDLFHKYTTEEVSQMLRYGDVPEAIAKKIQQGDDMMESAAAEREDCVLFLHSDQEDGADSTSGGSSSKGDEDLDIDAI